LICKCEALDAATPHGDERDQDDHGDHDQDYPGIHSDAPREFVFTTSLIIGEFDPAAPYTF
jgi:hypothetical protein